jgi:hypothetical protein
MASAAENAREFCDQVGATKLVFTLVEDDSFLVFDVHEQEVVPFWSSLAGLEAVREAQPEYAGLAVFEIPLEEFLEEILPQLEADQIHVGIDWSGEDLTGFDLAVADVRRALRERLEQDESTAG